MTDGRHRGTCKGESSDSQELPTNERLTRTAPAKNPPGDLPVLGALRLWKLRSEFSSGRMNHSQILIGEAHFPKLPVAPD